jgi:hypothetical protein
MSAILHNPLLLSRFCDQPCIPKINIGSIIEMNYNDNLNSDKIAKLTICIFIFENNLFN